MEMIVVRNVQDISFEPTPKWVRVLFGSKFIADSKRARLLSAGGPPYYYFPREDIRLDLLEPTVHQEETTLLGKASFWTVRDGDRVAENAAWTYLEPASESIDLSRYITFDWDEMDAWFEEDEEVYIHPHDPHKRIDILESTRHVKVVVLGEKVADTHRPILLFETGLPVRYYCPGLDVRRELLVASDKITGCAYKGRVQYCSVKVGNQIAQDIAWYYQYPGIEATKIRGRIAFFNERLDVLCVDGEKQDKPETIWS